MSEIIKEIESFIINNKLEKALKKLSHIFSMADSAFSKDATLILGQFNKLKSDIRIGILDYNQQNQGTNIIRHSTLSLLGELKNNPKILDDYINVENNLTKSIEQKGKESLSPQVKDALYDRMSNFKEKKININLLWIDENPDFIQYESDLIKSLGIHIDFATSSSQALESIHTNQYQIILSDISRNNQSGEGFRFHKELIDKGIDIPYIFYTAFVKREKGVPPYAFGIAALPNELLHLILDILARNN